MAGWVPQSGRMGLGVSIFSYDGQVVVGSRERQGTRPRPGVDRDRLRGEFEALVEWAGRRAKKATPGKKAAAQAKRRKRPKTGTR